MAPAGPDAAREPGSAFDADSRLLLAPEGLDDPYPIYHRLRSRRPAGWSSLFGGAWLITSHRLAAAALRDDERLSMEQGLAPQVEIDPARRDEYRAYVNFVSNSMLVRDGRAHLRLRSTVARSFTAAAVRGKLPLVRRVAEELLAPLAERREFDLAEHFAHPLPTRVIAEMMGLPREDGERLRQWASDLTVFLGGGPDPAAKVEAALASTLAISRYFEAQVAERRRRPGEDLISDLLAYRGEGGDSLRDKEVVAQCLLLFTAGHQTTADLLSHGAWLLLRHPDVLRRVREDPELLPAALEEVLRYDSPVQMAGRLAIAPLDLDTVRIPEGERVILVLGAANRDPERFPEPDRFLVPRPDNPHLAFGGGPHQCLGAFLARLEGKVALELLFQRLPGLRLAAPAPVRELNLAFRRVTSLPVAWG